MEKLQADSSSSPDLGEEVTELEDLIKDIESKVIVIAFRYNTNCIIRCVRGCSPLVGVLGVYFPVNGGCVIERRVCIPTPPSSSLYAVLFQGLWCPTVLPVALGTVLSRAPQ